MINFLRLNYINKKINNRSSIYLQFRNCRNHINVCEDNLNICINTINKYLNNKNMSNILDEDIDIILFYLYKIISSKHCNDTLDSFISKNKSLYNYGINHYNIKKNIIIGEELNKYIKYEKIEFIQPLKLNNSSIRSSIQLCRDNIFLNRK